MARWATTGAGSPRSARCSRSRRRSGSRLLLRRRRPHVVAERRLRHPVQAVVGDRLLQADPVRAARRGRMAELVPVVLPEADRADLVARSAGLLEREAAAARAGPAA